MVVVSLSIIIMHITLLVVILATGVIGASVEALLILRGVVPGVIGLLNAVPGDKLHHSIVREVAALNKIAVQLRGGAIEITLRTDVRESSLNTPMIFEQTRSEAQRLLMRVIRTTREVKPEVRCHSDILCLHIDCRAKGSCTIRRSTHTTLYLHRLHTTGKVAHIHPIELGALRIVHRNTVGSDVDAARISTTHAQRGIADAVTSI